MIGALLSPYAAALNWPTDEMRQRGQAIQLLFGAVVAALSGTGVALAESNANISSVVGTAIAAALLPPTVNSGICFSYVIIGQYFVVSSLTALPTSFVVTSSLLTVFPMRQNDDVIGEEQRLVFYEIAVGSAMLVWINVIFIYFTAVLVFKVKKVGEFQLIRKVDEGAWTDLPRVQRSPTNADRGVRKMRADRLDSTGSVNSSHGLLDHDDRARKEDPKASGNEAPLSPLRRRQRPPTIFVHDDEVKDHVNEV